MRWVSYFRVDLANWGLWLGAKEMEHVQETDESNEQVMIPRGKQLIHIGPLIISRKTRYPGEIDYE